MGAYAIARKDAFEEANAQFEQIKAQLRSREAVRMEHSALEGLLQSEGSELLRRLFQAHLDLRSREEQEQGLRIAVVGADGVRRPHRRVTERSLMTLFGPVRVERVAYGAPGHRSLHPLDAGLNLPVELASHGVRERVAEEAAKGSFDETVSSIERTTGAKVAKRQVEEATVRAAADFDAFYASREAAAEPDPTGSIVVVSVDGKGVVMRPEDLRAPTRRAAARRRSKLKKRRSKGEKSSSKRMATVATVYTIAPFARRPEDIVGELHGPEESAARAVRPRPEHKRVWASVVREPPEVIAEAFREARRRDPAGEKTWVALVDGNATQIELLQEAAERDGVSLTIVLDVIHVLEYLWAAAWALHPEGSAEGEAWVTERLERILCGQAIQVAAGMRRSATRRGLSAAKREPIDRCARYLLSHRELLRYDVALAAGFPIATGVIEGACRHLVKDRMDLTGARWRLRSAEAVLRLRSLRSSGDFDAYWRFHLEQERQRNHVARYAAGRIPRVGQRPNPNRRSTRRGHLRRVK
jgi:hypothetical protein